MNDIEQRLREASVGVEEWRVADPATGSYCMSFSRSDSLSPEREAREWFADHLKRNPTSWAAGYEVRKVMAQSSTDLLMREAADEIAHLRNELEAANKRNRALSEWITQLLSDTIAALDAVREQSNKRRRKLVEIVKILRRAGVRSCEQGEFVPITARVQRLVDENSRLRAAARAVVDHLNAPVSKKPGPLYPLRNALERELERMRETPAVQGDEFAELGAQARAALNMRGDDAALRAYIEEEVARRLAEAGQYVTNDASRNAALDEECEACATIAEAYDTWECNPANNIAEMIRARKAKR